ncbi:MAG: agmatinase [bacterium]|nr:agmatinase [bacterium]
MFTESNVDFEASKVVVLPIPYEKTVTGRRGTRYGPQAILQASQWLELWDEELNFEPSEIGIHTLPEIKPTINNPEKIVEVVYKKVNSLLVKNKFPVILGGEHSISIGAVKALSEHYTELSVVALDAHADLRDEYENSKYSHACVVRRIQEIAQTIVSGVRSLSKEEAKYISECTSDMQADVTSNRSRIRVFKDLNTDSISELSTNVYLNIDLDVLDPGIMPSVGTPEPGGFGWYEILEFLKTLIKSKKVIGFDVVELCPIRNNQAPDYLAAKLVYKILGYTFRP